MKWGIYVLVASTIFALGWKSHANFNTNKTLAAVQEATAKAIELQTKHAKEKADLEKQITDSSALATRKIKKLIEENSQIKGISDTAIDSALAVYARLCDTDNECSLLHNPIDSPATGERISVLSILYVIRKMDEAAERTNIAIEQMNQQVSGCHGR